MNGETHPYDDQAARLRELVGLAASGDPTAEQRPRLVVVGAGRRKTGTTTVAIQLATAVAQQGTRCALIDANFRQPQVAETLGVTVAGSLWDVLAGRLTLNEVAQSVRPELLVVPGGASDANAPAGADQLDNVLLPLASRAELIVVDVGCQISPWLEHCWSVADLALWTTTGDRRAVLDSYAAIKLAHGSGLTRVPMGLIVNRCESPREALDVHRRIAGSCRRFLGETLLQVPPLFAAEEHPTRPEAAGAPRSLAVWVEKQLQPAAAASLGDVARAS